MAVFPTMEAFGVQPDPNVVPVQQGGGGWDKYQRAPAPAPGGGVQYSPQGTGKGGSTANEKMLPAGERFGYPTVYNGTAGIWVWDAKAQKPKFVADKDMKPPVQVPVPGYPGVTVKPETADEIVKQRIAEKWKADHATLAEQDKAMAGSYKQRAALETAGMLLEKGLKTGKVEDVLLPFRNAAASIPWVKDLVDANQLSMQTVFNGIMKDFAQSGHIPGTGTLSERDMTFLLQAAPGIEKPEDANWALVGRAKQFIDWQHKVQKARKTWLNKNGTLDDFTTEGTPLERIFPKFPTPDEWKDMKQDARDTWNKTWKDVPKGGVYIDANGEYQTKWD